MQTCLLMRDFLLMVKKNQIIIEGCPMTNTEKTKSKVKTEKLRKNLKTVIKHIVFFPKGIPYRRLRVKL